MSENLMDPITGLSESKLQLATAIESDVLSDKTFYSGDKELKTGTFDLSSATATEEDVASGKTFYAGDKGLKTGSYKKTYTTVYLGQNPGYWSTFSYNVKSKYPSLYASLTRSNFYAVPVKYKGNSTGTSGNEGGLGDNCSYSPSTGMFYGYTTNVGPGGTWAGAVIYNFYMVY